MNTQFVNAMNSFTALFEGSEAEINRLKDELERKEIILHNANVRLVELENEIKEMKRDKRKDYGVRSFEDYNGKRWYVLTDLTASMGFSRVGNSGPRAAKRVHLGTVRKFTYRELLGKIECPPGVGVRCVDEKGRQEMLAVSKRKYTRREEA